MAKSEPTFSISEEVIYIGVDRPDLRNTLMIITERMHSEIGLTHMQTQEVFRSSWFYKTNYHVPNDGWSHESDFRKVRFDEEGEQNEEFNHSNISVSA